jgi:hypothetical protein
MLYCRLAHKAVSLMQHFPIKHRSQQGGKDAPCNPRTFGSAAPTQLRYHNHCRLDHRHQWSISRTTERRRLTPYLSACLVLLQLTLTWRGKLECLCGRTLSQNIHVEPVLCAWPSAWHTDNGYVGPSHFKTACRQPVRQLPLSPISVYTGMGFCSDRCALRRVAEAEGYGF